MQQSHIEKHLIISTSFGINQINQDIKKSRDRYAIVSRDRMPANRIQNKSVYNALYLHIYMYSYLYMYLYIHIYQNRFFLGESQLIDLTALK